MPAVSIIMPVYNSEKYLKSAVKSVLDQTFKDFELILVDDGSSDKSGSLCDEFSRNDNRVVVIHKTNGGICSARNAGLDAAKGEYIGFIDNDDEYLPDFLMDNYNLAKEYDADVVRFERKRIQTFDNGTVKSDVYGVDKITGNNKILLLEKEDLKKSFYKVRESGALFGIWNGLFKKSIINDNNLRFNPDIRFGGEDIIMNMNVFKFSDSYLFNKQAYYIYNRSDAHSTSTKFHFNRIEALLEIGKTEKEIIDSIDGIKDTDLKWFELQINCVIEICDILSHKNCDWSYGKKKSYLYELQENSILSNDDSMNLLKRLYKINKKKAVIGFLFYRKNPGILYYLVKSYFKAKE